MSEEHGQAASTEDQLIRRAVALHQTGDLSGAATLYREVLSSSPQNFDATHLLGVIALQEGRLDVAQRMINAALAMRPNDTAAMGNLGTSYLRDGQLEAALQWFEIAVTLQPESGTNLVNAARTLYQLGRYHSAIPLLEKACALDSSFYAAHNLLGACFMGIGDEQKAANLFEAATDVHPDEPEGWANLSVALAALGQSARARECASKAARLQPDASVAPDEVLETESDEREIGGAANSSAVGDPAPSVDMILSYAHTLLANGLNEAALEHLQRGLLLDQKNLTIRWAIAMAQLKTIYRSEPEVAASRLAFGKSLDEIKAWYDSTQGIETPYKAVGTVQPFLLAYQHYNNRDLLKRYGELCAAFMATLPKRAQAWVKRPIGSDGPSVGRKIRLGVVSAHIREHSIWTAITKGWLQHLDRGKFDILVFHLSPTVDRETEAVMGSVQHFDNRPKGLTDWVEAISGAELDVILYPEIGIEPLAAKLAALRLAPIQAVTWGHPETSGLPTMDLYFSAEAFEPANAAETNYSEKLVRLPNLGIYVEPLALPDADPDLELLKLPVDQALLLCPGQPFKYAPEYDDIWVRIAKGLQKRSFFRQSTTGRLIFFRSQNDTWDHILEARLRAAFSSGGIDFDAHVSIVPFLDHARFFGLMRRASLMLDTLGFSGVNTALQGIECGLPVLGFEGDFLRGRLASGILRELDLPELVATGPDEFARMAVTLAQNPDKLRELRLKISERRARLFRNLAPVRALESCLIDAVAQ